jgi:uncharacterized protein (DUF58 family)
MFIYMLKAEKYHASLFLLIFITIIELSSLTSKSAIKAVHVSRSLKPYRVFPGDQFAFNIFTRNTGSFPSRLKWEQQMPPQIEKIISDNTLKPHDSERQENQIYLKGHSEMVVSQNFHGLKRGYYKLPRLALQSRDFLGLFTRNSEKNNDLLLIVYPKIAELNKIYMNPLDISGLNRIDRPYFLDPIMFAGLREYTPDTPSAFINWKASAHKDMLLSKIVESSSSLKLLIAVDIESIFSNEGIIGEDMFERALSIAAAIAVRADEAKIPFGFIGNFTSVNGNGPIVIPLNREDYQITSVLEALAGANSQSAGKLEDILNSESSFIPRGTSLIIVGDCQISLPPPSIVQAINYPLTDNSTGGDIDVF